MGNPERAETSESGRLAEPAAHLPLIAYRVGPQPVAIVPAPAARAWIDATDQRFARRCLPLMMANQAGWFLLNGQEFRATWDGGDHPGAVRIDAPAGSEYPPAESHFGHGILTFRVPFLFRTPPGWNLLVRGPANWPKDGASALEGLVETDWSLATFTMNWKLTTPGRSVSFAAGEPFCMVTPQHRGVLERFVPRVEEIAADPDTQRGYDAWRAGRDRFLADLRALDPATVERGWQRDYLRGNGLAGSGGANHQTRLRLRSVEDPAGWSPPPGWLDEPDGAE